LTRSIETLDFIANPATAVENLLLSWLDEQLAAIVSKVEAEEVKTIFHCRN
jgi:hypothetical protein